MHGTHPLLCTTVLEGELCVVYHSLENARVYHQDAPQRLELPAECMEVVVHVMESWPRYVKVGDVPGAEEDEEVVEVVVALYDAGLLSKKM